jgi:hypothetical protein
MNKEQLLKGQKVDPETVSLISDLYNRVQSLEFPVDGYEIPQPITLDPERLRDVCKEGGVCFPGIDSVQSASIAHEGVSFGLSPRFIFTIELSDRGNEHIACPDRGVEYQDKRLRFRLSILNKLEVVKVPVNYRRSKILERARKGLEENSSLVYSIASAMVECIVETDCDKIEVL